MPIVMNTPNNSRVHKRTQKRPSGQVAGSIGFLYTPILLKGAGWTAAMRVGKNGAMDAELRPELRDSARKMRERRQVASGEAQNAGWIRRARAWAPAIAWLLLPGLLLALVGPFGSFLAPLPMRLLYWVPTMAVGGVLGFLSARVLVRAAPGLAVRRIAFALLHAAVVTTLMVLVVWGWGAVVFGPAGHIGLSWTLVFYVGLVSVAISVIRIALGPRGRPAPAARHPDEATAAEPAAAAFESAVLAGGPRLARRLKPELRAAEILALEAEDHYVRVHTSAGSDLILLRLSDAIQEMAGTDGLRPHRSWWVARAAINETRRADGRLTLALKSGLKTPVSRAAAAEIRAALEAGK